ncbi:MAG TPA: VWA domain-containing protein [Pyrinomonadaceae bacterium]|nr:VWA domain-containing protein [Pyrinomonadaceae bacterium]
MKSLYLLLLIAICFTAANAQEPEVIRTRTELVQTAVTVLDKKGNFVDGLNSDQFELIVDGKPRQVAFFERISAGSTRERELAARGFGVNSNAPLPPATVPGRTIVFFIDDLHLSPDSLSRTRMMLQHFLERELNTKDSVAIASASGQIGFLEQFTNNREVLDAATARLVPRMYDVHGYSAGNSTPMTEYMALTIDTNRTDSKVLNFYIEECMKGAATFKRARGALALIRASCETQVKNSARAVLMQAGQITQNTYNSLESLMRSAARAPGRKIAFFVSDGFLLDAGPHAATTRDKLDHVIDAAQRAGVVVYTIHAQGLVNDSFRDAGNKRPMDPNGRLDIASVGELEANQDALSALAADTGGRALRGTNFFDKWVSNVLDETSNYYLVAWRPERDEEKVAKFRHVKISVVGRSELTVRTPRGYVDGPPPATPATASTETKPAKTPDAEIRNALTDSFPTNGLPVLLSLTYLNTPANGLVVTSSMEIAGNGLTYGDDGKQPATIRLAGVVLNDKGKVAGSFRNELNINPRNADDSGGVFYNHHTPLTPGIYQFRVAARDEKSGRVGSATQWIVIPDLSRNQLTLSSVLLGGQVIEDRNNKAGSPQVQLSVDHSFPRNFPMPYWVFVYNAKRDAGGNPQLTVQTHVLRDGRAILSSPQRKVNNGGPDLQRIPFGEELALKTLAPGRYDLKVTITDGIAGTTVSRLADFTVR